QLIEVEVGELRGHEVRFAPAISGSGLRRDRILLFVVQSGVKERPRSMHLGNGHPSVPVRDRSKSSPRMEVDAGEAEGGWNEGACLLPIGPERLAVLVELRVESARAPGAERLLHGGDVNSKKIGEWREVRSKRDDDADIQVPVRPAVQAFSDARSERVVDRGVAERALDTHRGDPAGFVKVAGHSDDRVELEQAKRRRGIIQIDLALLELLLERVGKSVCVYLETHGEGCLRAHPASHSAVLLTGDGLVELQCVSPEGFASERVVAKDLLPLLHHPLIVFGNLTVEALAFLI